MPDYRAPVEDLTFVLNDLLDTASLGDLDAYEGLDADLIASTIEALGDFAAKELAPLNADGDRSGATLGDNGVESAPGFAAAYRNYVSGGWPALTADAEHGGDGMPPILQTLLEEILAGANFAFAMAPLTAPGAYRVIAENASEELKQRFLPKIVSGEWGTAMSLTEPQGGSALALVKTRALPEPDGTYRITGTKMFNSWGDHDMADNIVHLVLARLPDAPAGTKGISLFLVPKYLVDDDGALGDRNAFSVGSLEKKMGIHASPTCVTNFDGATGYLIGQPHRGMASMFIIMNAMRLASGACAVGIADTAYHNALDYARERLAGRSVSGAKYPDLAGDPILVHPDVRRMLLSQRAFVEGGRAFAFWVALELSRAEAHSDSQTRADTEALVGLLTPVVKAFLTDRGFESTDAALQCFGGHGYVRDNGAEQYLRDIRMLRIGEGTSGIQALDFVGRKILADDGATLQRYFDIISETLKSLHDADLTGVVEPVRAALDLATRLTADELAHWRSSPERMAASALDYLHLIGYLSLGYVWAKMAGVARRQLSAPTPETPFLQNKIRTAEFYCAYVLPEIFALDARVRAGEPTMMAIPDSEF